MLGRVVALFPEERVGQIVVKIDGPGAGLEGLLVAVNRLPVVLARVQSFGLRLELFGGSEGHFTGTAGGQQKRRRHQDDSVPDSRPSHVFSALRRFLMLPALSRATISISSCPGAIFLTTVEKDPFSSTFTDLPPT